MLKVNGISLNFSEACNISCTYCYVPHNKQAMPLNIKLRNDILNLSFFDRIISRFDKSSITHIGLWGAEPTLNLDVLSEVLSDSFLEKYFPNLENIHFSTNLSKPISLLNIKTFLMTTSKLKHKISLDIQVSLDGPVFLHNTHRVGSDANVVIANLEEIQKLSKEFGFKLSIKPTYAADEYKLLSSNNEYLTAVFAFSDLLKSRGISYSPSTAIPGRYTVEDGKNYGLLTRKAIASGYQNLVEIISVTDSLLNRSRLAMYHPRRPELLPAFSYCSAGSSSLAIDNEANVHLCQGTFLSMLGEEMRLQSNKDSIEKTGLSFNETALRTAISPFATSDIDESMYEYVIKEVTKSSLNAINITKAFLKILAISKQLSPVYKEDEDMLNLLAAAVIFGKNCINSNVLTTGTFELTTGSIAKLYGNGALEAALDYIVKRESR